MNKQSKKLDEAYKHADRMMKDWPEWKKNVLVDSMRGYVRVPRKPFPRKEDSHV